MKTIRFKCYAACCMAFLGMGCTASFEEYNTNPNQMEMWEIGPESLLENLVFKEFECLLHRTWYINGELIQYTVSGSSLNAFHRYVISNGVPSDHWGHAVPVGGHGRPHVSPGVGTERRQLPGHRADDARLLHGALHRRFRRRPLYGGVSGTRRPRPAAVRYAAVDLRTALRGFGVGQQPLRCFEIAQIAFARPALRRRHGQMETVQPIRCTCGC